MLKSKAFSTWLRLFILLESEELFTGDKDSLSVLRIFKLLTGFAGARRAVGMG